MNIELATPLTTLSFQDYPDPEAHALVVSFVGCPHKCPSCHNRFLQDKQGLTQASSADDRLPGRFVSFSSFEEASAKLAFELRRNNTRKLVLEGGEPLLFGPNLSFTKYLCSNPAYEVCIYTGYDVKHVAGLRLSGFQYLKCGLFDITQVRPSYKTDEEMVLASPNQEFYDHEFRQISINGVLKFKQ